MARTEIPPHDAPDLASDAELAAHAGDSTSVHGIADTSLLSTTAHDHDADYEAAGGIATHSADTTAVHGIADTSALSLTSHDHDADYEAAGGIATHSADSTSVHGIADTSALSLTSHDHDADYEATGAVATHAGLADPHTGYRLETADHDHSATGLQGGTVAHTALTSVGIDDHHARDHAINGSIHTGTLDDAQIPAGITRDAEAAAAYAAIGHSHGGSSPWTTIIKPADTGRTNNTVSADPDLVVTLLANTNYVLYLQVFMLTNATADARYQLTFGGTTTRVRRQILRTATGDVAAHITVGTAFDAAPVVLSTTGLNPFVQERIILQVGASGGSFAFQWAQVTTNGSPCSVLEGSYLEYAVT